jgi:ubiquitin-conjugating enzyme E2 R
MSTFGGAGGAIRALKLELKSLQEEPMEGFRVNLVNDANLFEWQVAIFGPPGTLYEGGYFKALIRFPTDYPYAPPRVKFLSEMWHPNVYENGDLCISILHPPVDDPQSGELPCERWNPTQNVRTILLSVISLLNEPNTSSPANVDASVMFKRWRDSKGANDEYAKIIKKQVEASQKDAEKDGVVVPKSIDEYCVKHKPAKPEPEPETFDLYDDDYYEMSDDEEEEQDAETTAPKKAAATTTSTASKEEEQGAEAGPSTSGTGGVVLAKNKKPNDSGLVFDDEDSGQGEN